MKNGRIIVGENGIAGLPISAPIVSAIDENKLFSGKLRWVMKQDFFVLEQWTPVANTTNFTWEEVLCVESLL